MQVATFAVGLSGRSLRKIPFQAHAFYCNGASSVDLPSYLNALMLAVKRELHSRVDLAKKGDTSSSSSSNVNEEKK